MSSIQKISLKRIFYIFSFTCQIAYANSIQLENSKGTTVSAYDPVINGTRISCNNMLNLNESNKIDLKVGSCISMRNKLFGNVNSTMNNFRDIAKHNGFYQVTQHYYIKNEKMESTGCGNEKVKERNYLGGAYFYSPESNVTIVVKFNSTGMKKAKCNARITRSTGLITIASIIGARKISFEIMLN